MRRLAGRTFACLRADSPPLPGPPPRRGKGTGTPSPVNNEGGFTPSPLVGEGWGEGDSHGLDERVRVGTLGALLVSPVWGLEEMEELAASILASRLPVRFQTQLHKHIWGPDRAGV